MAKEKSKRKEREEGRKKEEENYTSCTEMPSGCSNRAGYTMRDLRREISFVGLNSEFQMTIVLTHFVLFFSWLPTIFIILLLILVCAQTGYFTSVVIKVK